MPADCPPRAWDLAGAVFGSARYLGPHLAFDGSLGVERVRGVAAARAAGAFHGKFWHDNGPRRWARILFQGSVTGTLTTGRAAFVPSQADQTSSCGGLCRAPPIRRPRSQTELPNAHRGPMGASGRRCSIVARLAPEMVAGHCAVASASCSASTCLIWPTAAGRAFPRPLASRWAA